MIMNMLIASSSTHKGEEDKERGEAVMSSRIAVPCVESLTISSSVGCAGGAFDRSINPSGGQSALRVFKRIKCKANAFK